MAALFDCDIHILTIVDIRCILQTDMSCHKICDHVGNEMHAIGCKIFVESRKRFCLDEATSVSKNHSACTYMILWKLGPITFLTWFHWAPWTKCIVCVCVYVFLQCLEVHGFSSETLANHAVDWLCIRWCFCNICFSFYGGYKGTAGFSKSYSMALL